MGKGKKPENLNPFCMLMDEVETGWQTHLFLSRLLGKPREFTETLFPLVDSATVLFHVGNVAVFTFIRSTCVFLAAPVNVSTAIGFPLFFLLIKI